MINKFSHLVTNNFFVWFFIHSASICKCKANIECVRLCYKVSRFVTDEHIYTESFLLSTFMEWLLCLCLCAICQSWFTHHQQASVTVKDNCREKKINIVNWCQARFLFFFAFGSLIVLIMSKLLSKALCDYVFQYWSVRWFYLFYLLGISFIYEECDLVCKCFRVNLRSSGCVFDPKVFNFSGDRDENYRLRPC